MTDIVKITIYRYNFHVHCAMSMHETHGFGYEFQMKFLDFFSIFFFNLENNFKKKYLIFVIISPILREKSHTKNQKPYGIHTLQVSKMMSSLVSQEPSLASIPESPSEESRPS